MELTALFVHESPKEDHVEPRTRTLTKLTAAAALVVATACASAGGSGLSSHETRIAACATQAASCNIVSGYAGNDAPVGLTGATISGGGQRGVPNRVSGDFGSVGGGDGNLAGEGSTVAGGSGNTAINFHAAVGGGASNAATAQETTVAGGLKNTASGRFATVGGGAANLANALNATVAGGSGNTATFTFATVGGGVQNTASSSAAVVAGGDHDLATGAYSAVLGGLNNEAAGYVATIGGGAGNVASGSFSAIPGGFANAVEADFSFAAGRKAFVKAEHPGTFLFADAHAVPFRSAAANEFAVRATGGVRFVTSVDAAGSQLSGVRLSAGSGSWETLSDVNSKSGFAPVDGRQVLQDLMSMPIRTWSYNGQDPSIRHIGPTAQDFRAAFHVGQDGHYISTVDADGVALAAIQELYRMSLGTTSTPLAGQVGSLERRLALSNALAAVACAIALASLRTNRTRHRGSIRRRR